MKIAFRTDASLEIGTGHVMRCLTLAEALRDKGAQSLFICREHEGNLLATVRQRGFEGVGLPACNGKDPAKTEETENLPAHAAWLGCDWQTDARQSAEILSCSGSDWLIVDHYALDVRWEKALRSCCRHLMVIDDLADRSHDCDVLLDQNLGRNKQHYHDLVPDHCALLVGPQYALLRPEFARLRHYSLKRRENVKLRHLLISMGGVDKGNATGEVLKALKECALPDDCRISVIMGASAPWLAQVRQQADQMPWPTEVAVNVSDMAQRMANADLAVGAAGGTSWERCCLGLPTLLVVVAENQWAGARALDEARAGLFVGDLTDIAHELPKCVEALWSSEGFRELGNRSSQITDGHGAQKVVAKLEDFNGR